LLLRLLRKRRPGCSRLGCGRRGMRHHNHSAAHRVFRAYWHRPNRTQVRDQRSWIIPLRTGFTRNSKVARSSFTNPSTCRRVRGCQ